MKVRILRNKKINDFLVRNRNRRFIHLLGGASSGKSHGIAQYLIRYKWQQEKDIGILALRKVRPAIKTSCWELVHNWADKMRLFYTDNKADLTMTAANGNVFHFDGLDNVFKKRSIEKINYIWIEEPAAIGHDAAFAKREFIQLDILCRAHNPNGINQIFLTYNPLDPVGNAWLKDMCDRADVDPDSAQLHLTHLDNPFLHPAEHKRIEALADQDPEYDKIYRQGQWATPTAIIYSNWDIVSEMPEKFDERVWGLDFGYSGNPAALVEIRFCGDEVFEREHIYQTELTNPQLISRMRDIIKDPTDMIVADSEEPKSIREIRNAGFNVHPSNKGPDSVRHGIKTVQSIKTHITADSINHIKEKQGYKWKVDMDGKPVSPPKPLKFKDHLMDAERYAIDKVKGKVKAGITVPAEKKEKSDEWDSNGEIFDEDDEFFEANPQNRYENLKRN